MTTRAVGVDTKPVGITQEIWGVTDTFQTPPLGETLEQEIDLSRQYGITAATARGSHHACSLNKEVWGSTEMDEVALGQLDSRGST